jgi:hypothetical protein
VLILPVTGVPESSACATTEAATDAQRSPNRPSSYYSNAAAAVCGISARSKQENGRSPRGEEDPQSHPASDAKIKGEMRQKHISPHTNQSQQQSLFTPPSALCSYFRRSTPEYGANGDLIGPSSTKISLNRRLTPGNNLCFHDRGAPVVVAPAGGDSPGDGRSRTRCVTSKAATPDRYYD